MLNGEEKKAIELLRNKNTEYYYRFIDVRDAVSTLLNLIDKQQKEIEKYKNVIRNLNNNWISKEELKNILEKLKIKEQEMSDEQGYWGGSELQGKIEIIEELLEENTNE